LKKSANSHRGKKSFELNQATGSTHLNKGGEHAVHMIF